MIMAQERRHSGAIASGGWITKNCGSSWIGDAATTRSEVRRQNRSDDAPLIASQNNDHIFSKD